MKDLVIVHMHPFLTALSNFLFCSQATLLHLKALRLAISHSYMYKKLDEYGENHDEDMCTAVKNECKRLCSNQVVDIKEEEAPLPCNIISEYNILC